MFLTDSPYEILAPVTLLLISFYLKKVINKKEMPKQDLPKLYEVRIQSHKARKIKDLLNFADNGLTKIIIQRKKGEEKKIRMDRGSSYFHLCILTDKPLFIKTLGNGQDDLFVQVLSYYP